IGILLLNMRRVKARAGSLNPFRALAAMRTDDEAELEALAGLSVGTTLAADDEARPSLTQRLLGPARRYQATVSHLSSEAGTAPLQRLADALGALAYPLAQGQAKPGVPGPPLRIRPEAVSRKERHDQDRNRPACRPARGHGPGARHPCRAAVCAF